jgi:hypothetical protein
MINIRNATAEGSQAILTPTRGGGAYTAINNQF